MLAEITSLVFMQTSIRWNAAGIPVRVQKWFRRTAVLLLSCLCLPAIAATYTGRVVSISDGDTLTVLDAGQRQRKIRLAGIDAPERRQAWGERARQFLGQRVHQRIVRIETGKTDRYGREVGKVWLDGEDVNLALVRAGLAWHYRAYAREQAVQDRLGYARAEQEAREERRGLWSDPEPQAPWDYRAVARR